MFATCCAAISVIFLLPGMKFLILVAGTNDPSNVEYLADRFGEGLKEGGADEVVKIRVRDLDLRHFTADCYESGCPIEPGFARLQREVQSAQGVVIATPIWNFSVPAHLKNAFDRMGSFALDRTRTKGQLRGLPFYCIFTGGSPQRAWILMRETTSHIGKALEYFGAIHTGTHFEPRCMPGKGVFGLVVDKRPDVLTKMRIEGKHLAEAVKAGRVHHRGNWLLRFGMLSERLLERWGK
jgi:NAD(P)H-dependent FMN reductase